MATVDAYDVKTDRWRSVAPIPQARWGTTAVEAAGKLVVVGGITGVGAARQALTAVDVYDPATNVWSAGQQLPITLQSAAVAVYNGDIFVAGGRIGAGDTGRATDEVWVLRSGAAEWTKASPLLGARTAGTAVVVGSRMAVVGGASGGSSTSSLELLDLSQPAKWIRADFTLSTPRTGHVAAGVGGRVYVIGGTTQPTMAGITGLVEEVTIR